MGSFHLSPEELLKRVMGDPSDAILKQKELSEATYPLLVAYFECLRRINAIQNNNDVIHQNEEFLNEFIFLCEHNLLFFLTVTGRFDIIRSLFKDKHSLAKEIALIEEIEKEHAQATAANLHYMVFVPRKNDLLTQSTEEFKPSPLPTSEWERKLYGLTNMDLYQYYEAEMKRINNLYHVKHIQLIDTSYEKHINLMHETLKFIEQDEQFSEEKKHKTRILYHKLIKIKEKLKAEYHELIHMNEGPLDFSHERLQGTQMEFKEVQKTLELFLEEVRHEAPQLQVIYEDHKQLVTSFKKESQSIQVEWAQEVKVLSTHYENVRSHAVEDLDNCFNILIDDLQKCPVDELNEEQINILDARLIQLKEYQKELNGVENYASIQNLLVKYNKELEIIARIVLPVLPEEVKNRFDLNLKQMKCMLTTSSVEEARSNTPTLDLLNKEQNQEESSDNKNQAYVPIPNEGSMELELNTSTQESSSLKQEEPEVSPAEEVHLHRYRFFINTAKDETELIHCDSEKQRNYESTLKELSNVLRDLNEEVEPEILAKIKEIESLIQEAKSMGFDKANLAHIQKIYEACDLGLDYEPLNQAKSNLASMFQLGSQNHVGI